MGGGSWTKDAYCSYTSTVRGCSVDSFKVYYVTRTYLTRHGVGRLDRECARDAISNNMMEDKTNVPNPFQNHLRYAPMDYDALIKRIVADCKPYNCRITAV